jgi:hypothetical protein
MMRKSLPKLVLRKETLRSLSGIDLARVIGGDADSAQVATESGDKQCGSRAAAVIPGG